jgi:hypothetical protein
MSFLSNLSLDNPLYVRGVFHRFWMQPSLVAALWLAEGASAALALVRKCGGAFGARAPPRTGPPRASPCAVAVALALAAWQCRRGWPAADHSGTWAFRAYGQTLLASMPRGALLLVSGDLNHNASKYVQQCEGFRRDVAVLSPELMSYPWYVQTHARHYPRVLFPADVYHPTWGTTATGGAFDEGGRAGGGAFEHIFIAGGYKEGDGSAAQFFERVPFGLANRLQPNDALLASARAQGADAGIARPWPDGISYARRLLRSLPRFSLPAQAEAAGPVSAGPEQSRGSPEQSRGSEPTAGQGVGAGRPVPLSDDAAVRLVPSRRHPEGSWERALLHNVAAAFHESARALLIAAETPDAHPQTLKLAYEAYARGTELLLAAGCAGTDKLPEAFLRTAGAVAGQVAAELGRRADGAVGRRAKQMRAERLVAEQRMLRWWRIALRVWPEGGDAVSEQRRAAIEAAIARRINLYSGEPLLPEAR